MKYAFIRDEAKNYSVELMCMVLEISRSGYYDFFSRGISDREQVNKRLLPIVEKVFSESRKTYGYRRVSQALQASGESCGYHKRVPMHKGTEINVC